MVDCEAKSRLRKSGSGKITIDSGAGESVCPISMVPPLHNTAKNGTTYRAAGGQSLVNRGEKRVEFKSDGMRARLGFQTIEEMKNP